MDELDFRILGLLQQDGRMPYSVIARKLNANEATVRKRVERLIREGVVEIIGVSNPYRLGFHTHVLLGIMVDLPLLDTIADTLANMPELSYVACSTGEYDIVAVGVFESDDEFYDFLTHKLASIQGIRAIRTSHLLRLKRRTFSYRVPDIFLGDADQTTVHQRERLSGILLPNRE